VDPPGWVDAVVWVTVAVLLVVFTVRQVLWLRRSRAEHAAIMRQVEALLNHRQR
jgi:hypothetical protein